MSDETQFASLGLRNELNDSLAAMGYEAMTTVQAQALPLLLAGSDVLARAKTGSGKTAAFGLGLLNKLDCTRFEVQALVLCPTRELADQVTNEVRRLAQGIGNVKILSLCGGKSFGPQVASLQHSPHIIVGTPGRVLKHLGKGTVNLDALETLVLDEADRMLDMGFTDELNAILKYVPAKRQTLLFSATYPDGIASISRRVQRDAQMVDVTDDERPALITQYWCSVTRDNRVDELVRVLRAWGGRTNLVFCNTKIDCDEVARALAKQGIAAVALHGDLDQIQRTLVLTQFSNRSASVMVATDVAARGLDVKELDAVVNFELPKQAEVYVHRIGRTARAGMEGIAISLVEQREEWRLKAIEEMQPDAQLLQRGIPDAKRGDDALTPLMTTVQINGGRKNKLRAGDLLGALTAEGGVPGDSVGSIDLFDTYTYVAVKSTLARQAAIQLGERPIKGRSYRARLRR